MAEASPVPRPGARRCFICREIIVHTNYISLSSKSDSESKRNKIFLIEKFLSVQVDRTELIYIDRKCNRVVENIDSNLKKLQELYRRPTSASKQAGNVAAQKLQSTPRKSQGEGRVDKRMATSSPSSVQRSPRQDKDTGSYAGVRTKKRAALSFLQPSTDASLRPLTVSAEVSYYFS